MASAAALPAAVVGWRSFLAVVLQLGLLTAIVRQFQLETALFHEKIMPLVFFGFLIHYLLPQRHRLSFFVVLSFVGIYLALGFPESLWLLGLGLLLIGVCHLPLPLGARAALVAAIAAWLTVLRTGRLQASWAASVLPILAAMFMFRIIVYLHHLGTRKGPFSLKHTLAYFFMLPNVAFPLFPIVDYNTFCRTYYDSDERAIHQKGIRWILLGIVQLLAYRYVHYYWVIPPEEVIDLPSLARHAGSDYLLILRLVGQFTLIVGILVMFGFNLPVIVERFFLAGSFTDYWRRANIYWRDFLQKVFVYPVYFRLRKLGPIPRLVVSILVGFAATWFLHAYQWFWIRGSFQLSIPDVLFWSALAVCVIVTAVYENTHPRRQARAEGAPSLRSAAGGALRALLVFVVMSVLWSLWTSPSVADWFYLWIDTEVTLNGIIRLIALLLLAYAVLLAAILLLERPPQLGTGSAGSVARPPFFQRPGVIALATACVFMLATPLIFVRANRQAPEVIQALQRPRLNAVETELLTRGYYETLNASNQFTSSNIWELQLKKQGQAWPALRETEAGMESANFLRDEIRPSVSIVFHGAPLSTNRWAMRDKDYEQAKPAGVYRVAVMGGSQVFGSGVTNEQTFEALLEDRLNSDDREPGDPKYEVLNFAVPAHCLTQHYALLESKVASFEPDAVLLVGSEREERCTARHLATIVSKGIDIPYEYLSQIVKKARVEKNTPFEQGFRRLKRYGAEIVRETYPRFASFCRERGIVPVYAYTPNVEDSLWVRHPEKEAHHMDVAKQAGFVVLNVADAYDGVDVMTLKVTPWDWHPNVLGHKLLADGLYDAFRQNEQGLGLRREQAQQASVVRQ